MKVTQQPGEIRAYRIFWQPKLKPDISRMAPIPLFSPCTHIAGNGGATWLDRPLRKNKPIQQRLIAALEDWQKKYLRANETIKQISHGKHILYHCDVEKVCGDAEIYCFDSVINTMEDHARAEVVTGSSSIKYVQGNAQIQYLGDHAIIFWAKMPLSTR